MLEFVKEKIKQRKILYHILSAFQSIFIKMCFELDCIFRKYRITLYFPFKKLENFKEKHQGERCFIVATGPSLDLRDLDKLQEEVSFSMNSIVLSFDKTKWRPTYYFIQDGRAYQLLKKQIFSNALKNIFIGINYNITGIFRNKFTERDFYEATYFPLDLLNHNLLYAKKKILFSKNPYQVVYDGYTITYSILQLAVYMGFKEIYLIGMDCDYTSEGKKHIVEYVKNDNGKEEENKMMEAYETAKRFAEDQHIKIYNASRGGKLNVFERVDFNDIFQGENQNAKDQDVHMP